MVGRATRGWGWTLAVSAVLLLPAAASAEVLIPPGNSAVNQYTESYPSAGGDRSTRGGDRTPAGVLGPRKARRLEARGPAGEAAAALVAATAPRSIDAEAAPGAGGGSAERGGGSGSGSGATSGRASGSPLPDGSSGLSEVLGQATGLSTTGAPGALLPLAVLLTAAWALAYLWRRKRPTA